MKTKKKRSKLLATTILIMILLILTAGARLVLDDAVNKQEYEITRAIYTEKLASMKRLQQEGIRVAAVRKAEEARVEAERLAEIAKAQADRKQRLEAERLKRNEEKKNQPVLASRGNENVGQWIQYEATYYSAFCNTGCTGITKMGWDVSDTIYHDGHRVIAVDPKVIPLGSLVQVKTPNETFYALAGDTGGAIKSYRIDILVDSTATAYKLGRHPVQVRIVESK